MAHEPRAGGGSSFVMRLPLAVRRERDHGVRRRGHGGEPRRLPASCLGVPPTTEVGRRLTVP